MLFHCVYVVLMSKAVSNVLDLLGLWSTGAVAW